MEEMMTFAPEKLDPDVRKVLRKWDKALASRKGVKGLWVSAGRQQGSSQLATQAWMRANLHFKDEIIDKEFGYPFDALQSRYTALDLIKDIRQTWTSSDRIKYDTNQAVWDEYQMLQQRVDWFLLVSPVVFLDDLHFGFYDPPFWQKHVWPHLEKKLKDGGVVVVASNMPPEQGLGAHWEAFFDACVVTRAER